jgi:hypothetical protein
MTKILLILAALISISANASNQFCGNLGTVRSGYDGDYYVSSIVLYNGSITNDSATAYNDKYLNVRNDNNSVTNGFDTVDLIERIFFKQKAEQIVDYAWEQQSLRDLKIEVCLEDFNISTRNNGGRIEARANDAKEIKISLLNWINTKKLLIN